jgi:hypothetical protein
MTKLVDYFSGCASAPRKSQEETGEAPRAAVTSPRAYLVLRLIISHTQEMTSLWLQWQTNQSPMACIMSQKFRDLRVPKAPYIAAGFVTFFEVLTAVSNLRSSGI